MPRNVVSPEECPIPAESETRIRTVPPPSGGEAALFDQQLRAAEEAQGERARAFHVAITGVVGSEPSVRVLVATAPDGPRSPPEDVWSEPVLLVELPAASVDSVRRRVAWVLRRTAALGLAAPEIDERWSFGSHSFRGDPDGVAQLLDARLRLASLSLDDARVARCTAHAVPDGAELVVTAHFEIADGRPQPVLVELLGQPKPSPALAAAVSEWIGRRAEP